MRQHLAAVLWTSTLSACSLIYNPSNIDKNQAPPDAPIADSNPALLRIDEVKSPPLLEGAGQDGSAPQLLVVYGGHISKTATVTLAPKEPNANLTIELANVAIADDGNSFAGTVKVGYMDSVDEGSRIPLVVTVMQDGAPAPVSFEDEDGFYVKALDELTTVGVQPGPNAGKLYSKVEVNGAMEFAAGGQRVVIRAVGLVDIKGTVRANASGTLGGAGGCNGGGVSTRGECYGGGGGGVTASAPGGGGGFAERGMGTLGGMISGDSLLSAYDDGGAKTNRGAGGGGGAAALNLAGGGPGGGGGGAIDIAAGGNLFVQALEANGAPGTGGGLGGGGGGGAGGAVVLRAGGMLMFPTTVSLAGADGGGGGGGGGKGSPGRWRYDANGMMGDAPQTPAPGRGPMINFPANPIFDSKTIALTAIGDAGEVEIVVRNSDGDSDTRFATLMGGPTPITPPNLSIGYNLVCVVIAGGDANADDGKNCIEVAFVP